MSLFRDINDAQCLSLDGHAVDGWNSCLKPSLSCQHNSGVHGGSRGRAAGVQLRVSVPEIKLFRRQNVPQCFHTVSFALKIKTTQGCTCGSQGVFQKSLDASGAAWVRMCLEPASFSCSRVPCARNKQGIAGCCVQDPAFQSLAAILGEEIPDLV